MMEGRVTKLEQAIERIEIQVIQIGNDVTLLKEKLETVLCKVDDHQEVLYGDKGRRGLISKIETIDELNLALKGYGREPGLIADIQALNMKISEWDDGRKWLTRLIIGAVIAEIFVHLLGK